MIAVIDGPAGSGKSTTARAVAGKLGIEYLDSGALYRALAVLYVDGRWKDDESFFDFLSSREISFRYEDDRFRVWIDGEEVTGRLRSSCIAAEVSRVASMPQSRTVVNRLMREAVRSGDYVAEGRDLGTVVFPDADIKFFMSASLEERSRRRFAELRERGTDITLEEVRRNITGRDRKDTRRKTDPLRKAEDAIEIDTTNLTFEQQVGHICSEIAKVMETEEY